MLGTTSQFHVKARTALKWGFPRSKARKTSSETRRYVQFLRVCNTHNVTLQFDLPNYYSDQHTTQSILQQKSKKNIFTVPNKSCRMLYDSVWFIRQQINTEWEQERETHNSRCGRFDTLHIQTTCKTTTLSTYCKVSTRTHKFEDVNIGKKSLAKAVLIRLKRNCLWLLCTVWGSLRRNNIFYHHPGDPVMDRQLMWCGLFQLNQTVQIRISRVNGCKLFRFPNRQNVSINIHNEFQTVPS